MTAETITHRQVPGLSVMCPACHVHVGVGEDTNGAWYFTEHYYGVRNYDGLKPVDGVPLCPASNKPKPVE